ncbi:HNH endonuclease signature motif containing protein [Nocardioides sp. SYSU DS0651]|uniref:HNH endonuclease signature motif containing protein n=1 Tax=Nocardioides sp. SYSU DS0651 TaxID=3415955 RepID=UPI003F4BABB7
MTPALQDMTEDQLLEHAEDCHRREREAAVEKLRIAYQWAVLHNPERLGADTDKPGRLKARRLGGAGTPMVTETAAARLGARLGLSLYAAQGLIADALDIYLRHPQLAERVEALEVRASYARHVVAQTRDLTAEEAAFVDHEVTESADGRIPWSRFELLVRAKVAAAAPELTRRREEEAARATFAKKCRGEGHGMATFMVRADVATIDLLDAAVGAAAGRLAASMPEATDDERRVHAVRLLSNPGAEGAAADLHDLSPAVQLYVHVFPGGDGIARLEGHGPVTEAWISRVLGPRCRFRITPVLDIAGQAPVDAYEIPARHRTAVRILAPADIFPFAANTTRATEIDHTIAWSDGGPSAIGNYGPMTRRHHRIKTHDTWDVKQPYPGIYLWRDPHGGYFLVDHTGTRRLGNSDPDPPPDGHLSPSEIAFTRLALEYHAA